MHMGIAEVDQREVIEESLKKNSDPRLMGALWLISRRIERETELLVVHDEGKLESPAGLSGSFTQANEDRWGIIGGGRQVTESGRSETAAQTLQRELEEELGDLLLKTGSVITKEAIDALYSWSVEHVARQLLYPFLVGQLVLEELTPGVTTVVGINEIAAAVFDVPWEELPLEVRLDLQRVIKKEKANWVSLKKLEASFNQAAFWGAESVTIQGLKVRPQVLTAAKILALQQRENPEKIVSEIQGWNRQLKRFLGNEAAKRGIKVKNGAIGQLGAPKAGLAQADYQFLNARPLSTKKK
jgi:8-oxo-dGTP pyrophosphatase MutT (NUDIX family)